MGKNSQKDRDDYERRAAELRAKIAEGKRIDEVMAAEKRAKAERMIEEQKKAGY